MKPRPPQPDWPVVLTEWNVISALRTAGLPPSLAGTVDIPAALVSEVSAYLRFRTLEFRELEAEAHGVAAAEAVFAATCGSAYDRSHKARESAQRSYLIAFGQRDRAAGELAVDGQCVTTLRGRMLHAEDRLAIVRRQAEPAARAAQLQAIRSYWIALARQRIPEDIFKDAPRGSAIAAMPRLFPTWWGWFVQKLVESYDRSDPAYARLLQELPRLRAEAGRPKQVLVFSALVRQWREAHAERYGLLRDVHYPVIEQRAWVKVGIVEKWFEAHARGYKRDSDVREAAARRLYAALAETPPELSQAYWNN
ncbi:MAG: hypothetical protein HZA93_25610 [Verrucomicrobia bacterium]|nr:hypothetical protein [Verrucomicrobiota bacterium]